MASSFGTKVIAALRPFFRWNGRMCLDVVGLGCLSYRYG